MEEAAFYTVADERQAICALESLDGEEFDLWSINTDSWYSEEQTPEEQPYIRTPALSGAVGE